MWFFTFCLINLLALITPGPDFFFVSQTALSRSRSAALWAAAGITLGVAVWALISLLGLHYLFQQLPWLQPAIRLAGGLFLCWMSIKLLLACWRGPQLNATQAAAPPAFAGRQAFWRGLLTNLSNPKALVYFGSIFSLYVGEGVSVGMRTALFAVIIVETIGWFTLVATLFSSSLMQRHYQRAARAIDGGAGLLFLAFGLKLIVSV